MLFKRLNNFIRHILSFVTHIYTVDFNYLLIILTLCPSLIFAQQKEIEQSKLRLRVDSLITIMINVNTAQEKVKIERDIYNLSKSIGYHDGLIYGRSRLIDGLFVLGNFDQVLKLIDESLADPIALQVPVYSIKLLRIKARSCAMLGLVDQSKQALNQARSYALNLKDNNEYHTALGDIDETTAWNLHTNLGDLDSAIFYLRDATQQYGKLTIAPENNTKLFYVLNNIGLAYFEKKHYDSAKKYLLIFYKIKAKKLTNDNSWPFYHCFAGARLEYIEKNYQTAIITYQKALNIATLTKLPYHQKYVYKDLAHVYHKLGDHKKEAFFLNKYSVITDSLAQLEKKELKKPLESFIKNDTANNRHRIFGILLIALLIILIASSIFFNRHKKKPIQQEDPSSMSEEFQQESSSPRPNNDNTLHDLLELAKTNSSILYTKFNEHDPMFCKRLLALAPNLLIAEQELCIYIRLNLDTKEIAQYTRSSVKSIQARKYRIRKKINIPTKEDMTNWIISL